MKSGNGQPPSTTKVTKFWDLDSAYEVKNLRNNSPLRILQTSLFNKEVISVNGATDTGERSKESLEVGYEEHQSLLPRLPIPPLQHTCDLYLESVQAIATPEEYLRTKKHVEEFLKPGGTGELLHNLLVKWDETCGQPSWLEEFWDDSYLCTRDPIPVNVNYFFKLQPHPQQLTESHGVSQLGRAASLLHAATEYHLSILNGTVTKEFERGEPVCMSQYRFLFATSRVPGIHRDRKICYSTRPLTSDEKKSKFAEYIATDPTHCVVIIRNRYFKVDVLRKDGTQYSIEEIVVTLKQIENCVTSRKEPGAPVGLFTTLDRTDWFHARERLKKLGNDEILQIIQSAIICLCLDGAEVTSPDEAAKIFLHGPGTNRWFDRHNIIVTRDGSAGINWEHSVADGGSTLRVADFMYRRDCERFLTEKDIDKLMETQRGLKTEVNKMTELLWSLDGECDNLMKEAFANFKIMIESNETNVIHFNEFGGVRLKHGNVSPDAFVQLALQLTYYRIFGHNCATYETASTRTFCHGRTECVRSHTNSGKNFCCAASNSLLLLNSIDISKQTQSELMRTALESHTRYMKLAKKGFGVDRHFYGLRVMARMHSIPEPTIFTDECFQRSATWTMSTSHCGSSALDIFGFGPVVKSGFGIGYMIKAKGIDFVVTSKHIYPFNSASVFASMLHSSLMHMESILRMEKVESSTTGQNFSFSHPCGLNDFEFVQGGGFIYKRHEKESLRKPS